ncbi:MAG TPA: helix-turn-helix transcriptional regulator [Candidatus Obscuribacterales bacterium]
MIKNELQYRVKKATLKKFRETLDQHDELTRELEPWARDVHRAAIEGEMQQLKNEIKEYERIKSGKHTDPPLDVVAQIPSMFIQRRIALGWTQEEFAKRLGVRPQQVQADEANNYASANLTRLIRTAAILKQARNKSPRTAATAAKAAKSSVPKSKPTSRRKKRKPA